jgi:hypothetical protein
MGTVYLAVDNLDEGQLDAVKVLNRDWLVDRERLRREAVTANRVDHPNVCRIYNYVEAYDTEASVALTLVAMELVRGPTLREVQEERGGVLELSRAARVVKEVAEALQAIHAQDIIHRDIKPTNIIVTADSDGSERVKIVDFGIAKKVGGGEGQDLTEPGMVAATVHYASPEQLRGKPGKGSDVYALGVVLYELLAGRRPYEASNQAELFSMILDPGVKLPRLQEIRPDLNYPRSVQAVVERALERDPSKRFAGAAEFSAALTGVVPSVAETVRVSMADLPPPTLGPTPLPASESAWERIRRTVLPTRAFKVGISVGALVLAAALFFGLGGLDLIRPAPGAVTLSLDPPSALVRSGESLELEATVRDQRGRVVERDGFGWASQDPDVAGVRRLRRGYRWQSWENRGTGRPGLRHGTDPGGGPAGLAGTGGPGATFPRPAGGGERADRGPGDGCFRQPDPRGRGDLELHPPGGGGGGRSGNSDGPVCRQRHGGGGSRIRPLAGGGDGGEGRYHGGKSAGPVAGLSEPGHDHPGRARCSHG